jgi:hypothetical protein
MPGGFPVEEQVRYAGLIGWFQRDTDSHVQQGTLRIMISPALVS